MSSTDVPNVPSQDPSLATYPCHQWQVVGSKWGKDLHCYTCGEFIPNHDMIIERVGNLTRFYDLVTNRAIHDELDVALQGQRDFEGGYWGNE